MPENPWTPSDRTREPAVLMEPVIDPAGWYPDDMQETRAWMYRMSDGEIAEVLDAVAAVEASGRALKDVRREDFPLPGFAATLDAVHDEVMHGRGFALLRGLPVEGRSRLQIAIAFWGIGAHIGEARSQNAAGHLLGHVKNLGADYSTARGYMTKDALAFHSDRADILSLCCLHPARSGGQHRIVSSVTIYNEMLKRRPDLVKELTWRFYRERNGEIPPGEERWVREPIFSVTDGYFTGRGPGSLVFKAQRMPEVPRLTDAQKEAIDMFNTLALELAVDIDLEPGDITFVMNHVTVHSRTAYEDWPEPERKRHLLRLWLRTGERPVHDDVVRALRGVVVEGTVFQTPLDAA